MAMQSILIVEDDMTFSTMLRTWLAKKGFQAETAGSVAAAKRLLEDKAFDLILSDFRLPDNDGINLLPWKKSRGIEAPLIIMTSYADIQNAVLAMKEGASDYVSKPIKPDLLLQKINDALAKAGIEEPTKADAPAPPSSDPDFLEGESDAARKLYGMVALVAPTQMSVLINGASGTGKEYVAHRIHRQSRRADKPFVAIDCGSIPKELAASEFFGHVKGSFTGALADKTGAFVEANGGTLFLDEVGNLSYEVQVQLLRALQERKVRPVGSTKEIDVDVRLVTATNEDLQAAIAKGTFREDLYHRLNEFTLQMPALRERGADILLFADFFLRQANRELDRQVKGFDAESQRLLMAYPWPGNLRQLKNLVKRATLLADGQFIHPGDFADGLTPVPPSANGSTAAPQPAVPQSLHLRNSEEERTRIVEALQQARYNKSKAAQLLGVDRKTLYNKIKQYGL